MSIYLKVSKLDIDRVKWGFEKFKVTGEEFVLSNVPSYIYRYHKKKLDDGNESISMLSKHEGVISEIELLDKKIFLEVYIAEKHTNKHPLSNFFPDSEILDLQGSSIPSAVFYLLFDNDWYAITINRGYLFIGAFIDLEFPINMARRIMNQSVKNTKERDITGVVYGRVQQFRTNQLAESQSIGTIWSGLDGYIEDIVRNSVEFIDIFNPKQKKVGISVSTGIEIRSSLNDYTKLLEGLLWVQKKDSIPLLPKERKKFAQLDGIKEVRFNEFGLISSLEKTLAKNIQNTLLSSKTIDYDFSHTNFMDYQSMDIYSPIERTKEQILSFSTAPTAEEVIKGYHAKGWLDPTLTDDAFLIQLKQSYFVAYKASGRSKGLSDPLFNYLHGEVEYNGKGYFFIDGRWYRIDSKFEKNLKDDFNELLLGEFFDVTSVPVLQTWTSGLKEGPFNELHKLSNFVVSDRAFLDNIELADIIHIDGNKVHMYHNKIGFGASTRDVCSQVFQSMNWIARARKEKDTLGMEEYYDSIVRKHYPSGLWINRDDFVNTILGKSSEITYIVGYARKNKVNSRNSKSNIAKFEILKLCKFDKRLFDFDLKILWIETP